MIIIECIIFPQADLKVRITTKIIFTLSTLNIIKPYNNICYESISLFKRKCYMNQVKF